MNIGRFSRSFVSIGFCLFLLTLMVQVSTVSAYAEPMINGKTRMTPGEEQTLSIMNYQTGNTYTWSITSGGGSLSSSTGERGDLHSAEY